MVEDGLRDGDFSVSIGGSAARVFFAISLSDRYVLVVQPPSQTTPGLFDLEISALGAMDLTPNAIRYTIEDRLPVDVPITIDRSGSMAGSFIEAAREAAALFVKQMIAGDKVAVIGFNHGSQVELPLTTIRDAGVTIFSDDIEIGTNHWRAFEPWGQEVIRKSTGTTTVWSDSPGATSGDNIQAFLLMPMLDLSGLMSPSLQFDHFYDYEDGWDFGSVLASGGPGDPLDLLKRYSGTLFARQQVSLDLSPYAGQSQVTIAFLVTTDSINRGGTFYEGWQIDNVAVGETETRGAVRSAILGLFPRGMTSIGAGLLQAQSQLDGFAYSGRTSWTDSPDELYFNGLQQSLFSPIIDLRGINDPQLRFATRYEIEAGFDIGAVYAKGSANEAWTRLNNYSGASDWKEVVINVSDFGASFAGSSTFQLDFRLETDDSRRFDGWYIDDVEVRSAFSPDVVAFFDDMESGPGDWIATPPWAQYAGRASPDHAWSIILLSDGFENSAPSADQVLPRIIESRTRVFTIALGPNADQALLQRIASLTGGQFFLAPGPDDLAPIYSLIAQEVNRLQRLIERTDEIVQDEITQQDALIDPAARASTFSIAWTGGGNDLDLALRDPSGAVIDPADSSSGFASTSTGESFTIQSPDPGLWTLQTSGTVVETTPTLRFKTFVGAITDLEIYAYLDRSYDRYFSREPFYIMVGVADAEAITGAELTARITGPEGEETLKLLDDGFHRDGAAGDGLYGAVFTETGPEGGYKISIAVGGLSTPGDEFVRAEVTSTIVVPAPPVAAAHWATYL